MNKENWLERDLNLRPPDWRAGALPTELSSPTLAVSLFCQYLCSGAPVRSHETKSIFFVHPNLSIIIIVIVIMIVLKICSTHVSTLLGAQGAETKKKTWIQCNEIHVQCNYKCTSSFKNCDIGWVLSSDLNLVILWQDLSLVGRWFQSLGATTEKDLSFPDICN